VSFLRRMSRSFVRKALMRANVARAISPESAVRPASRPPLYGGASDQRVANEVTALHGLTVLVTARSMEHDP
jgi:hypothetical protein